jgi:hypothetical protein
VFKKNDWIVKKGTTGVDLKEGSLNWNENHEIKFEKKMKEKKRNQNQSANRPFYLVAEK